MTGWSWEYIDDYMTIPRFIEMTAYWKSWPPTHQLVASFVGYKDGGGSSSKSSGGSSSKSSDGDLDEFIRAAQSIAG